MSLFPIASLIYLASFTNGLHLLGKIVWNDVCPGFSDIHPAAVSLDNGRWSANIQIHGNFTIHNVPPGTFLLSVLSHDFQFDQLRIDVADTHNVTVYPYTPATPFHPPSPVTLPYPLILSAKSRNIYFVEKEAFNVLGLLKSPMMLMMLVTGAMLFAMPYLMANMDPETRNEIAERQQKMLSAQTSLQNMDMGGLKNLLAAEPDTSPNSNTKPSLPPPSKGKSKGRKR